MGFVSDQKATDITKQANDFARRFSAVAEAHGFDLPMEVLIPLIELFGQALRSRLSLVAIEKAGQALSAPSLTQEAELLDQPLSGWGTIRKLAEHLKHNREAEIPMASLTQERPPDIEPLLAFLRQQRDDAETARLARVDAAGAWRDGTDEDHEQARRMAERQSGRKLPKRDADDREEIAAREDRIGELLPAL